MNGCGEDRGVVWGDKEVKKDKQIGKNKIGITL